MSGGGPAAGHRLPGDAAAPASPAASASPSASASTAASAAPSASVSPLTSPSVSSELAAQLPLPATASGAGPETARRPVPAPTPTPAPAPTSAPLAPAPATAPAPITLLVIAKEPVPGRVKTRLTPPYRPEEAARLAEASLADTLETVARMHVRRRVLVLDGRPGHWLPGGFEVVPQSSGGLDERLAAAFALCDGPALLVGMDTPQLTTGLLALAAGSGPWDEHDAWFGPAADGGFWALGMARPQPELVLGVPMSRADTGARQRQRLVEAGLSVRDLPVLRDVDTALDAAHVAALAPGRFAAVHADLVRAVAR